ncbi:hypothetical protein IGL76_000744 [Enterococcus sp. DIV2381]|uniref:Transposase n=1 Tax=Candidatus Enterococcus mangumiae TaxID=2230878 RepID=A0ABZ2T2A0_9ENTE
MGTLGIDWLIYIIVQYNDHNKIKKARIEQLFDSRFFVSMDG